MIVIFVGLGLAAVVIIIGVVIALQRRPTRSSRLASFATTEEPAKPLQKPSTAVTAIQEMIQDQGGHRRRVKNGTLFRFDSVTKLVTFCRDRYQTEQVQCSSDTGEFLLSVDPSSGEVFESLIVHFEGEGQYAALLPNP